jgi:glycosyltransferase involved in cell wall biosynthesis
MSRVSVIIPCFNREYLLGATLDSLRAQTFHDWEGIVVDDQSADGSVALAQRYRLEDSRIRVLSRIGSRKGANVCRNQGLAAASGAYIVFLDSDDLLSPTCLENRVPAIDNLKVDDFLVYQTELFTQSIGDLRVLWNAYTPDNDLNRFLDLDIPWITTGPIWRRKSLEALGGFDESLCSFQDWDIHVRALIKGMVYQKISLRDNFHRHEYDKVNAISAVTDTRPDHLLSHERLFLKVLGQIKAPELSKDGIRNSFVGLFWWLAECWLRIRDVAQARRVWRILYERGFCNRRHYIEGLVIIKFLAVRRRGRIARLIQQGWPKAYYLRSSQTLNKTPLN